jgi:hypothetical protein
MAHMEEYSDLEFRKMRGHSNVQFVCTSASGGALTEDVLRNSSEP